MTYAEVRRDHVRVRLFPQSPPGGRRPRLETVALSPRRGMVGPGPSDSRMYVIAASDKLPYGGEIFRGAGLRPPWRGPVEPAVRPSPEGHFDYLVPADPGFRQAHLYGCIRFALDVWEGYVGRPIPWHFEQHYERLEIVALRGWPNAHMGYGFLEAGERVLANGRVTDLALDFDVVAHEIGHAFMMTFGGRFSPTEISADYEAFHEASSDWVALITALHFGSVVDEFMEMSRGNLDSFNRLNRFAEYSATRQIRLANNERTMWDFASGWRSEHELSQPVIAGFFDAFVEIYNEMLVGMHAIPRALEVLAERAERDASLRGRVQRGFDRAFSRNPAPFYEALREARDIAATILVGLWRRIDPVSFRFEDLFPVLDEVDRDLVGGRFRGLLGDSLSIRGVGLVRPGPRLRPPGPHSHMHSTRTAIPF